VECLVVGEVGTGMSLSEDRVEEDVCSDVRNGIVSIVGCCELIRG
jgi:hypothetical protein